MSVQRGILARESSSASSKSEAFHITTLCPYSCAQATRSARLLDGAMPSQPTPRRGWRCPPLSVLSIGGQSGLVSEPCSDAQAVHLGECLSFVPELLTFPQLKALVQGYEAPKNTTIMRPTAVRRPCRSSHVMLQSRGLLLFAGWAVQRIPRRAVGSSLLTPAHLRINLTRLLRLAYAKVGLLVLGWDLGGVFPHALTGKAHTALVATIKPASFPP